MGCTTWESKPTPSSAESKSPEPVRAGSVSRYEIRFAGQKPIFWDHFLNAPRGSPPPMAIIIGDHGGQPRGTRNTRSLPRLLGQRAGLETAAGHNVKELALPGYVPVLANCCVLHLLLSGSVSGSTKFSGLGRGHVLERARVCGSKPVSCSSAIASIGMPSLEMLSYMPPPLPLPVRNGEAGQPPPYGSMAARSTTTNRNRTVELLK
uniref:Uncharacterized protein n=1 Tax=Anopheles farauti TaxID=69004 RepID=A0A182QBL1_9DIPT